MGRERIALVHSTAAAQGSPARAPRARPRRKTRPREEDISAEYAEAEEDARVPQAYEHARRPGHCPPPTGEGPRPAVGVGLRGVDGADLTPRARRARLTRSGDFDAVYRRGRSAAGRHLVLYAFRRDEATSGEPPRLGVSVSRRVGGAVERNRLKRVLKERFAEIAGDLPGGTDFVVIARTGSFEYLEEHGSVVLGERLAELARKLVGEGAQAA